MTSRYIINEGQIGEVKMARTRNGFAVMTVAKAIGTSRASVTRWRQAYEDRVQEALKAKPHPGKPRRLTAKQRERLARLLLQGAGKHGYSTDLWTLGGWPK